MTGWLARPLDRVYPVVFIDAIHVKVRDGQVANRAFYAAIGRHRRRQTRHPRDLGVDRRRRARSSGSGSSPRSGTVASPTCASSSATGSKGYPTRSARRGRSRSCRLRAAPDPQHVPARVTSALGRDGTRPATRLHRAQRSSREGTLRRVLPRPGATATRRSEAVGERVDRVRAVPRLQPRDPTRDLLDERDRESPLAFPARDARARATSPTSKPR